MKRIVAIYGHHDCGKSETLNFLRELICMKGGKSLSQFSFHPGDTSEVFEFHNQIVCICPGGDTEEDLRSNFDFAYLHEVDLIVTAARTRGGSVDVVNMEGQKNGIKVEWMHKSYENFLCEETQKLCNREYAEVVMVMIDSKMN